MQSGKLNRRIQIQTQTAARDSFGQPQQAWTTAYTCWASIDVQGSQLIYSTAEFIDELIHLPAESAHRLYRASNKYHPHIRDSGGSEHRTEK
jgi:hypothetical protein